MQDSPLAILQAANLYLYTMHNPVKWLDPWGLFAVMVNYIAAKNNGNMSVFHPDDESMHIVVQIGGIRRTFTYGVFSNFHGRITMNHAILMREFGLTFEQATHQPWDRFTSMNSAAIAFSLMYTAHSTREHREIGAMIYSVRTGFGSNMRTHYTFGIPWLGGEYDVILGLAARAIWGGFIGPAEWSQPMRSSAVALAHTHLEEWYWFSQQDRNLAHGWFRALGIPTMPVFMSLNMGSGMEVRRFDNSMHRTAPEQRYGRLILSR